MAKAKKTESAEKTGPAKNLEPAAKKPAAKKKPAAATDATPLIDTNLAAQNAARMLAAGFSRQSSSGNASESAAFKQLKAGLNKPTSLNPLLDSGGGSNLHKALPGFKPNQQSANYNANVAKTGVPRRNPG